ncbi:MAG: ester cyclase [Dehalococcoidia bacterium]
MTAEQRRTLIRRIADEFWNAGSVDVLVEAFAPDVIDHYAPPGLPPGRDGVIALNLAFRTAFPDLQMTVDDIIVDGDRLAWRWSVRGTHQAALMGTPPTGKAVSVHGVSVDRFEGGRIVERWLEMDLHGLLMQISAAPTMA